MYKTDNNNSIILDEHRSSTMSMLYPLDLLVDDISLSDVYGYLSSCIDAH
jgi:hypothetical protein